MLEHKSSICYGSLRACATEHYSASMRPSNPRTDARTNAELLTPRIYLTLGIARRGVARFIPALVVTVLALTSCDSPPTLAAGVVTGKSHTDAWAYTNVIPCGNGCATAMTNMVPEKWTLHLKDDGKTGDHDVSAQEYFKYQVGEWYPR